MAAWFRRDRHDAVPKEFRDALVAITAALGPDQLPPHFRTPGTATPSVSATLPQRLAAYVLTGESAGCLTELAAHPYASALLHHASSHDPSRSPVQRQLYLSMPKAPVEVAVRWAQVLESRVHWPDELTDLDGHHEVEALLHSMGQSLGVSTAPAQERLDPTTGHDWLEELLSFIGLPPAIVVVRAFSTPPRRLYGYQFVRPLLRAMPGYEAALARHQAPLRSALVTGDVDGRLTALGMLQGVSPQTLALFADELSELASGTSAKVREAAAPLVAACGPAASEPLRALATAGKPDQRLQALRLLWSGANDEEERDWARRTAAADRAASVQALVTEWDNAPGPLDQTTLPDLQPAPTIDWSVGRSRETSAWLDRVRELTNEGIEEHNRRWKGGHPQMSAQALEPVRRVLSSGRPFTVRTRREPQRPAGLSHTDPGRIAAEPGCSLPGLAALLDHEDFLVEHRFNRQLELDFRARAWFNETHRTSGSPTLDELAVLLDDLGLDGASLVLHAYCAGWGEVLGRGWPDADVAPFVARNLETVASVIGRAGDWYTDTTRVYEAIGTLAATPPALAEPLFSVALGGLKTHQRPAQEALRRFPGRDARVTAALADGKADVRTAAARWIARDQIASAVPALEAAFAREKQDVAKGAILDALEALGQPVETYLDRDRLAADAAKTVTKGLPKDVDWFPWDALPEVRWADNGQLVAPITLQHLFAQAVKAKSPEPNALLRRYCSLFDPADRERLGQLVLDTWVAQDLKPVDRATAEAAAAQQASSTFHWMQTYPQHFKDDPTFGLSVEQLTAHFLPGALRQPAGSATASKGLLAVAAACAGERAAATASRYLQEWYGMRASQGKALIAMLAWVDHPSATQLVLSVGSRFRTKSFQDEATRQAEALAERRGWTLTELADRTIPTAGLDEDGVLHLSYGERTFTATLLPDLSLELRNPDGKKVASLPTPRQTDDESRAKESKKALAAARKEVKAVLKLQAERLYEALCTDRDWSFEDWDRYLNHHPLMHLLVQRLVWTASTSDEAPVVFRPLDDHTLTDVDDTEVVVKPDARVRLAHDSNLSPDDVQAWQEHLADYEVSPLFQQFGKGTYALDEAKADAREIEDFRGSLVEAFRLRGRATRLGYTRGAPGDGGWFSTYEKRFPTLGITSVVSFSGNSLPEENRTVALISLSFERRAEQAGAATTTLRLQEVPEVLLSEAWNDVRILAGEGTGPDPDWEKKVTY